MKVLAIVPYPELGTLIQESAERYPDMEVTTFVGYYGNAMAYLTTYPKNRFDMIISRGGTTGLLMEKVRIPVINIRLSPIDIVRVLLQTQPLQLKTAVITYSDIAELFTSLAESLGIDISVYPFDTPDRIDSLVEKCRRDGCRIVIGGAMARDVCLSQGLQFFLISSGREAIEECLALAHRTYEAGKAMSERADLFEQLADLNDAPTLLYDDTGSLRFANTAAWTLFGREEHSMKRIEETIPMLEKEGQLHLVQKIGSYYYKLNGHRFLIDGKAYSSFDLHFRSPDYRPASFTRVKSPAEVESLISACTYSDLLAAPYAEDLKAAESSGLTVHIRGEVGTKKDLFAHIVHREINGASSFVHISCRNVTEKGWLTLLRKSASPLYGTSYTIFFEDIDMLSLPMQAELVDYIRDTKLTSRHRVISCAHTDLSESVASGAFHEDLYLLLSGYTITMYPLAVRRKDIPAFLTQLLPVYNDQFSRFVIGFSKDALSLLTAFNWPLNLTQMETTVRQLVTQTDGSYISADSVRAVLRNAPDFATLSTFELSGTLDEIEKRIITRILKEENMNQSAAAKRLGIGRSTLWRKLNGK